MTAPKNKPPSQEMLKRFAEYYKANPSWGFMHAVLEDGNISDGIVKDCAQSALQAHDLPAAHLCMELVYMSKSQRMKLPARVAAYIRGE